MIGENSLIPNMPRLETGDDAALIFGRLEFALPCARAAIILHLVGDDRERLQVRLANDRRDQSAGNRHGDADIGMLVPQHGVFGQVTLAFGTLTNARAKALTIMSLTEIL